MFIKEELKALEDSVLSIQEQAKNFELWKKAFLYYNSKCRIGMAPLTMGCRPCYSKVLRYLKTGDINV